MTITSNDLKILKELNRSGNISRTTLRNNLKMSNSSIHGPLKRLADNGYIDLVNSKAVGNLQIVRLTLRGLQLVKAI